jgi:GNAT superfamily N-acetyltransferase
LTDTRSELIIMLEQLAANTWPAPIQQHFEHWRFRAGQGVTKRANSVWTQGTFPKCAQWLKEIEDFYARLALPVQFQISAATDPTVDSFLEAEGYRIESPSAVYITSCSKMLKAEKSHNELQIIHRENADEVWMDQFLQLEQFPLERKQVYELIFAGIGPKTFYLQICEKGETVGLGTAVLERNWAGFTNIVTAESHRGKGVGTLIMRSLAARCHEQGAEQLYLQVVRQNTAAIHLYSKLGFTHLYDYHYRVRG